MVGMPRPESWVRLRKMAPAGTKISSDCARRSAPPDSTRLIRAVLKRDVHRAEDLLEAVGVHRPTPDGRVVGDQHGLHTAHDADPGHDAAPDGEIGPIGDQWRQLEEG